MVYILGRHYSILWNIYNNTKWLVIQMGGCLRDTTFKERDWKFGIKQKQLEIVDLALVASIICDIKFGLWVHVIASPYRFRSGAGFLLGVQTEKKKNLLDVDAIWGLSLDKPLI